MMADNPCKYCNKQFEKAPTLRRHLYYCRSKQGNPHPPRKKSCLACTRAKARCNLEFPSCARCDEKGQVCEYQSPPENSNRSLHRFQRSNTDTREHESGSRHVQRTAEISIAPRTPTDPVLLSQSPHEQSVRSISTVDASTFDLLDKLTSSTCPGTLFQRMSNTIHTSHLLANASLRSRCRSFVPWQDIEAKHGSIIVLLLRILSSYTRMLHVGEFPPFIHTSQLQCVDGCQHKLPDPLLICQGILKLFYNKAILDRRAIWQLIRMEHERIWFNHENMDDWQVVAASQALLVYVLLRMIEGPTEDNDFDLPLLVCISNVATYLRKRCGPPELFVRSASWEDWVFRETHMRTLIIFGVLNIMVNVTDAMMCAPPKGLAILPLPARASLWRAASTEAWEEIYPQEDDTLAYALKNDGNLVSLRQKADGYDIEKADWSEWCASRNELGNLIATSALLLT